MDRRVVSLDRALELLTSGWTQKVHATKEGGVEVSWASKDATAWSLPGALRRATWELKEPCYAIESLFFDLIERVFDTLPTDPLNYPAGKTILGHVGNFNDAQRRTKEEILAVVRETKRRIEQYQAEVRS